MYNIQITKIIETIKDSGFTAYIAKNGIHGFYTNGVRVISFRIDGNSSNGFKFNAHCITQSTAQICSCWEVDRPIVINDRTLTAMLSHSSYLGKDTNGSDLVVISLHEFLNKYSFCKYTKV